MFDYQKNNIDNHLYVEDISFCYRQSVSLRSTLYTLRKFHYWENAQKLHIFIFGFFLAMKNFLLRKLKKIENAPFNGWYINIYS